MKKKEEGIQSSFVWAEPNYYRLILGQVIYEIATLSIGHRHSVLPSHRSCRRLLWKQLPYRRWECGIGIRIGVWFLFCYCFLDFLREDESVCFLDLLREDESWVLGRRWECVFYGFCLGNSNLKDLSSMWKKFSPQLCQHIELKSLRLKLL